MHIVLRAGEKLYLNGAVFRADRKVALELLNEATFLLEAHVISVEKATTPLRQLYFIVQMMLMNPHDTTTTARLFDETVNRMMKTYDDATVSDALEQTRRFVETTRYFDALKVLRGVFTRDDALMQRPALALAS